jgi:hypothetical protein
MLAVVLTLISQPSVDPVEVAARLQDDGECAKAVDAVGRTSADAAWALILACVDQDKFRRLDVLLSPAYAAHLRKLDERRRLRVAAHVLATSGSWSDQDFARLSKLGIAIGALDDARGEIGPRLRGAAIFRGRVEKRALQPHGLIRLYITEMARLPGMGTRDVWSDSGFDVEADIAELALPVREGNEYVFLARVLAVGTAEIRVDVLDVYAPGLQLDGLDAQ